jgi:uncharacterized protein
MSVNLSQISVSLKEHLERVYQDRLEQVILFGSRARGDAKPDSDFDILIVLKTAFDYSQEIERTSHFLSDLCLKNDILISRVFVDSQTFKSAESPFFLNVKREGVVL